MTRAFTPDISIIIPTHNRHKVLLQALDKLAAQTFIQARYEVIVVADGCTDQTVQSVKEYQVPYHLHIVEQEASGAAAARNKGAAEAKGSILLFLDDDIIASPGLVEAHVKAHQQARNMVVIGYLPPIFMDQKGFFKTKLSVWWDEVFFPLHQKGHRFNYRDLLSGNFSLKAELFNLAGGFDTSYKCQEDYELGVRLIQAHAQFAFAPQAMGHHNEVADLSRWLHRKYLEGKAAVKFCRQYPQLFETIPFINQFNNGIHGSCQNTLQLIYQKPYLAARKASIYRYALNVLEWLRMRRSWEKLLGRLQTYWYLRGLTESGGNLTVLTGLIKDAAHFPKEPATITEINLAEGIEKAEQKLNELRPLSIKLWYGKHFIGYIAPKSGFEALRGTHLRPLLAQEFSDPLMKALAFEKAAIQTG